MLACQQEAVYQGIQPVLAFNLEKTILIATNLQYKSVSCAPSTQCLTSFISVLCVWGDAPLSVPPATAGCTHSCGFLYLFFLELFLRMHLLNSINHLGCRCYQADSLQVWQTLQLCIPRILPREMLQGLQSKRSFQKRAVYGRMMLKRKGTPGRTFSPSAVVE